LKPREIGMQENAREKPLVRGRIEALLRKTTENGCTPGEARSALAKARELADRYGFAPDDLRWPVATSDDSEVERPQSEPEAVQEPSRRARGRGIGTLARELILEHPDWTYGQIAEEVNSRIEGARSTPNSVRWYSNAMRREGITGTSRVRRPAKERRNEAA
jgi:hypothetical protein